MSLLRAYEQHLEDGFLDLLDVIKGACIATFVARVSISNS